MAQPVPGAAPAREGVGVEPGRAERRERASPISEDDDQREPEPVSRQREQRHGRNGQCAVQPGTGARLHGADREA